ICSRCGDRAEISPTKPQRILEHMAAHILFDEQLDTTEERCGFCLRPEGCTMIVKKGRGSSAHPSVQLSLSKCPNLVRFTYNKAAQSTESAPCSNVPVNCPLCPPRSSAVWTYNLAIHFQKQHRLRPADFPHSHKRDDLEVNGLKAIWESRFVKKK
ncbi:hypothetical protein BDN72DRAFT_746964, partial [Pluteus cervinus]